MLEGVIDYTGMDANSVVLACPQLTDSERTLIMGKDEKVVEYAAKLIKEAAEGKNVNLDEFLAELLEARREANRSLGISEEI